MKNRIFSLCALALAAVAASAQVKIVTVNVQQCFDGYYKSVNFNDQMSSVTESFRTEARERQNALQAEAVPFQEKVQAIRENPGLSDAAKEEQLAALQPQYDALQQKQKDFEAWVNEKRQLAQQQTQTLRRTLIDDIKRVAVDVGIREGADLVLDTSDLLNSGVPTVLYGSTSIDITNKVLIQLNRDAPAE